MQQNKKQNIYFHYFIFFKKCFDFLEKFFISRNRSKLWMKRFPLNKKFFFFIFFWLSLKIKESGGNF